MLILLVNGFWIPFVVIIFGNAKTAWIDWRENVYHDKHRKFILLAIDVPRDNDQSPKAVENIFSHLYGIQLSRNNKYEKYWEGRHQHYISMELVSIEGYVQFIVYTMEDFRDIVESAIYSQYPDAEITQIEDYVYGQNGEYRNLKFPNDKYDIFGTEYVLQKSQAYPIRSWRDFEHTLSQELKDPMASLLENMNKIGPGEQFWFQFIITPEFDSDWQPRAENEAMRIAGKQVDIPKNKVDSFVGELLKWLDALGTAVFPFYNKTEEPERDPPVSLMLHLTPSEQKKIEGIQLKADKPGFWTKFRFIYIAEKSVFSKARGLSPIVGSLRQYDSLNLNGFRMHKWTKTSGLDYVFVERRMARRKNNIVAAFQDRSRSMGSSGMVLNVEELATLYHFPTITVKAPLVSRTQAKRSSAPISLPIQHAQRRLRTSPDEQQLPALPSDDRIAESPAPLEQKESAPTNLPFI